MVTNMDKTKDQSLKSILGIEEANPYATGAGIALSIVGLIGSLNALGKMKNYEEATKDIGIRIRAIGPEFEAKAEAAHAQLTADLAGYSARTEAGIKQGLINRGIKEPGIGEQATGQVKAGLSGAYAAARASLSRAKLVAGSAVSGALTRYQMGLAQKQYDSQMAKYYGKVGIWGALGGGLSSQLGGDEGKRPTVEDIKTNPGTPGTDERGGK